MKIVYFGTPEFAVKPLESLFQDKSFEIVAVITQPDKPQGRKQIPTSSPVKSSAKKLNLKVIQPENCQKLLEELKKIGPVDLFVVIAYGMIFSKEILKIPKYVAINVHASLLPKYRGASPIQEAILNGDKETGISIMAMNEKMDQGDIYLLKRVTINQNENYPQLSEKLSGVTANILPAVLRDISNSTLSQIHQNEQKASYCHKIEKNDGKINFQESAEKIKNKMRAFTPWPGIFTEFNSKKLKIIEAEISDTQLEPGKFAIEGKTLKIGTKKGSLVPRKLQIEGKNVMEVNSFINGYKALIK
ncbi:methionyl-tRNA formyltransferase [Candidatus Peregrinibacteria bacterium]|nr:methionyl-tRNA formyltransferase [Candidatus Peregrinibacteria bacterium]